jgi:hypothetical protein
MNQPYQSFFKTINTLISLVLAYSRKISGSLAVKTFFKEGKLKFLQLKNSTSRFNLYPGNKLCLILLFK